MTTRADTPLLDAAELADWWPALVALYREEADHAPDARRAARHLAEAARIEADELADPAAARALYEEAHALDPDDPLAARALAELAEAAADWPAARHWLEAALAATPIDAPARTGLLARLAALLHERLDDRAAAADRLREALDRAPDDRALLARLALVLPDDDPTARLDHLRRALALTDDPADRAALFHAIGRVRERAQGDDHRAFEAYRLAFETDPDHPAAIDSMVQVLMRGERWDELVETITDAVGRVADEAVRGRLHVLAALVLGARQDAPERARPHLGAAFGALGDDPVAALEIAGQYERLGLWKQANAVLEARADADPGLWYRIGQNREAGLGDTQGALDAHRRALAAPAESTPALAALRRAAWRLDDLDTALGALEGLTRRAHDPAVRSALHTHLADLHRVRRDDDETARRRYADAVTAAYDAAGPDTPLILPAAFDERLRLLAAAGNHAVIEEELTRALDRPLHPTSRARVAAALAELYETRLARPDEALALYRQTTAHDPDDRHAHEATQRLLAARGDHAALIDALLAEADRAEPARRLRLLTRVAETRHVMGDPEGVEAAWRLALDLDPGWLPALRGLGRLLHQHGRWRDLAALHRHELATLAPDDPRRAALLGKLAEICEFRLDLADEAIECYEAILELRPGAPDAVAGLDRLYRQAERWAALDRVLVARAAALDVPAARAVVLLQLADLRQERRDDPRGARAAYEEALALVPDLLPAAWAIERLALRDRDDTRLAALYREILPRLPTPGQTATVRHKLAAVLPPDEAAPHLEDAVIDAADPESAWALVREAAETSDRVQLSARLARFAQLVDVPRDALALWTEAAEQGEAAELPAAELIALWHRVAHLDPDADRPWSAILRLRRTQRQSGEIAALLLRRAEEASDPRERSITLWAAGLIEEARGMPTVGLDAFIEAAAACDTDPTPRWLILDRALGQEDTLAPAEHADQLVDLARRQSDPQGAAAHLLEAGRLRAEMLQDPDGALDCFLAAVRRDPAAEEAAERAAAMLDARELHAELADLLANRAARLDDPTTRIPILRRLADVQLGDLGRRAAAAETLDTLVQLAPTDLDARVRLADLRFSLEQFSEAAAHYRHAALAAHDDALLGRLYTRLGHIRARHLDDLPGAIEDLRRAVGLGTDERALGELAQVYLMAGEADLALMAFQRLEKLADDPATLASARAGQVHALLRRGRRAEAIERLEAFREVDPVDPMLATLARDLALDPNPRGSIELPASLLERPARPTDPGRAAEASRPTDPARPRRRRLRPARAPDAPTPPRRAPAPTPPQPAIAALALERREIRDDITTDVPRAVVDAALAMERDEYGDLDADLAALDRPDILATAAERPSPPSAPPTPTAPSSPSAPSPRRSTPPSTAPSPTSTPTPNPATPPAPSTSWPTPAPSPAAPRPTPTDPSRPRRTPRPPPHPRPLPPARSPDAGRDDPRPRRPRVAAPRRRAASPRRPRRPPAAPASSARPPRPRPHLQRRRRPPPPRHRAHHRLDAHAPPRPPHHRRIPSTTDPSTSTPRRRLAPRDPRPRPPRARAPPPPPAPGAPPSPPPATASRPPPRRPRLPRAAAPPPATPHRHATSTASRLGRPRPAPRRRPLAAPAASLRDLALAARPLARPRALLRLLAGLAPPSSPPSSAAPAAAPPSKTATPPPDAPLARRARPPPHRARRRRRRAHPHPRTPLHRRPRRHRPHRPPRPRQRPRRQRHPRRPELPPRPHPRPRRLRHPPRPRPPPTRSPRLLRRPLRPPRRRLPPPRPRPRRSRRLPRSPRPHHRRRPPPRSLARPRRRSRRPHPPPRRRRPPRRPRRLRRPRRPRPRRRLPRRPRDAPPPRLRRPPPRRPQPPRARRLRRRQRPRPRAPRLRRRPRLPRPPPLARRPDPTRVTPCP
ncbi:MAG: hypothetical protein H6705_07700 [Myxococcales bacterium]|nr:hypothetical protein [Myxococcales bacterium]